LRHNRGISQDRGVELLFLLLGLRDNRTERNDEYNQASHDSYSITSETATARIRASCAASSSHS
jgi:hypothetical protein